MPPNKRLLPILSVALCVGCASQQDGGGHYKSNTDNDLVRETAAKGYATPGQPATPAPAQQKAAVGQAKNASAGKTASTGGTQKVKSKDGEVEGEIIGMPGAKSKFAKLQIGMGQQQVQDLIGIYSDRKAYTTVKAWIPFYYSKDAYRFEAFYKGEGRLTFEGGGITGTSGRLIRIEVDPNESGYE